VKKTFLRGGEVSERRRGWLPYWGFCSKKVRTSIKKHRRLILLHLKGRKFLVLPPPLQYQHTCNISHYCHTTQQLATIRTVDMKTSSIKLGKNIKRIRERKEMSQGDICRTLGFDRAQMSNIEAGKGNPTLATIDKIAQALDVAIEDLIK